MATQPAGVRSTSISDTSPAVAGDRRQVDVGPPSASRERRVRHRTPSGLTATDGLKMPCPCCGGSESAVFDTKGKATCPQCGRAQSEVVKVRGLIDADAIRRRRECVCGFRFPTLETIDVARLQEELQAHGISLEKFRTAP
jgi:hypothetical protein